jgi:hypothetical protein
MTHSTMPGRGLLLIFVLAAVAALAGVAFLTDREGRTRNEALLFLDRYEGIDLDDPLDERKQSIDALAALPLSSAEVAEVRDVCVEAHRTLIRAEEHSAAARADLEHATADGQREEDIPTEVRAQIEAHLQSSNESLALARETLPRCMERVHQLEVRFRSTGRR